VYAKQPRELKDQPVKSLVAFERVHFQKGESRNIELSIPVSRFRHFDPDINDYSVAKGSYDILIGASSDDIRLKTVLHVK